MKILNNLAVSDRIELARTQNWTEDYWPFVFPIKDMNKCKCRNSEHLLLKYLNVNDYIKLPRRVIIKDGNVSAQLEEGMLRPDRMINSSTRTTTRLTSA